MKLMISFILLLLVSCSPSLYQLQEFEHAQQLKNEQLVIPLKDESEAIALFRKYGQNKKADRLLKETNEYNQELKSAFNEFYDFSDFEFRLETEQFGAQEFVLISQTKSNDYTDNNERWVTTFAIKRGEMSFSEVTDDHFNETNVNLPYLTKLLSNQLSRLYQNAK